MVLLLLLLMLRIFCLVIVILLLLKNFSWNISWLLFRTEEAATTAVGFIVELS
jgi:hypothetical protein